ncbi:MAG: hypothetical protein HPY53_06260 [Brevinematales bacterium]|nr:hypothetical protein [Brevinematales bacterium]
MTDDTMYHKIPMSEDEVEKLEREIKKLRLMYILYAVLTVFFGGMIAYGAISRNFILVFMGGLPILAYLIVGIVFSSKYSKLKKDADEKMMAAETGVLEDIYVSYGKGPKYVFRMNGKTRFGFREMTDALKKGDRIDLFLACNSLIPVGFKKLP